ncbi:5'-methylthioadenosine/adenosylhomocysteine nucleosidase [Campylobacter devanensis]|uniref:5'-methylthioadenosine/adenosylhomocysteine nucleosidase n=1 Tax=Campylobacter devanensis TaxID=3161138 RepID=UPI000A356E6E|nr:5'-methylthioadenosine/adenosylhomocysteine nucleosidase [Campylobacter sp. P0132]
MRIAILGAMSEEIEFLLKAVGDYQKIDHARNSFYKAQCGNHELVIAYSKIGKVNAALTAIILVEKFGCEKLIFTGVAGALNENLKIGDMLYATTTAQHDLDITAFGHPHGYVPGINIFENSDEKLNSVAKKVADSLGIDLIGGVVATGDQFICNEEKKEWLKSTFKADAVEMEGASVAQVCAALGVGFCMLRAISDEAGGKAEVDFDTFLTQAADKSAKFVLEMVKNI